MAGLHSRLTRPALLPTLLILPTPKPQHGHRSLWSYPHCLAACAPSHSLPWPVVVSGSVRPRATSTSGPRRASEHGPEAGFWGVGEVSASPASAPKRARSPGNTLGKWFWGKQAPAGPDPPPTPALCQALATQQLCTVPGARGPRHVRVGREAVSLPAGLVFRQKLLQAAGAGHGGCAQEPDGRAACGCPGAGMGRDGQRPNTRTQRL